MTIVGRPFARVLVANRGEIAIRIIRACHELGAEAVAIYSDADRDALHVRMADAAIRVGAAPAMESYLRIDAIVEGARASGAEAIHPGYGFLSERPEFARAVEAAGIVFVGPPSDVIATLGDKLAARRLATEAGVAVVPGTLEPAVVDPSRAPALVAAAEATGFPLLVKAAAGGGGRGMRRVTTPADLPAALASGAAEAEAAFGDGSVYLERELAGARHVEVQLLGDAGGRVVAVGERDCSLQRRHQKLVEEGPAPGLSKDQRQRLHAGAVRLAQLAGLRNAATAEFLLTGDGSFYFLEVNTRLQVEHGVTELVTGLDIVQEQLWIAAGRPLSRAALEAADAASNPVRHAIEVRVTAEDPAADFVPTPGRIRRWSMPGGPGIRVDAGVEAGSSVPPEYDNLIAKLLVVADSREAAIARLGRALAEVEIAGIQTTLPFHRLVASSAAFHDASQLSTDWVDRHWDGPRERARAEGTAALAAGIWSLRGLEAGARPGDPILPAATSGDSERLDEPAARESAAEEGSRWRAVGRMEGVAPWQPGRSPGRSPGLHPASPAMTRDPKDPQP